MFCAQLLGLLQTCTVTSPGTQEAGQPPAGFSFGSPDIPGIVLLIPRPSSVSSIEYAAWALSLDRSVVRARALCCSRLQASPCRKLQASHLRQRCVLFTTASPARPLLAMPAAALILLGSATAAASSLPEAFPATALTALLAQMRSFGLR